MDKLEKQLNTLREGVDEIDNEIVRFLKLRMEHILEIGKVKKELGMKRKDRKRNAKILKTTINRGKLNSLRGSFIKRIFKSIISEAERIEKRQKMD